MSKETENVKKESLRQFWICDNCGVIGEVPFESNESEPFSQMVKILNQHHFDSPICGNVKTLKVIPLAKILENELPFGIGTNIAKILKVA